MALSSLVSKSTTPYLSPVITCCARSSSTAEMNPCKLKPKISRRAGAVAVIAPLFLTEAIISDNSAHGSELRMTVPDQTVEEAQEMIRDHAEALLDVKSLIESKSWKESQRELRRNSAYLKQDIYTIIQSKEGSIRPLLRKLYANLFNNVTKLDYAARDEDVVRVQECYNDVAAVLNDILSRF